jgi:hypothetical protein
MNSSGGLIDKNLTLLMQILKESTISAHPRELSQYRKYI